MKFQKIVELLQTTADEKDLPRFLSKKWIEVYDHSEKNYNINKEIRIKTSILRSDLCDISNAYFVVKGDIIVTNPDDAKRIKCVAFKNNAKFINCISKINRVQIDNAEDLDVIMPMYNLLEYSKNYKKQQAVCGIVAEKNQVILFLLILNHLNTRQVLQETRMMLVMVKMVMMQWKLEKIETEVVVSLKHLSNFWRNWNIPLINCKVELVLTWSRSFAIADLIVRAAGNYHDPPAIVAPTGLEFQITNTKLYVPVVTL